MSRIPAVLDALVTAFRARSALADIVRDGPRLDQAKDGSFVVVGHDGSQDDTDGAAGSSEREFVGIGANNRRDQTISVTCAAVAWYGDNYPAAAKAARDRVATLLSECESAINADLTLAVGTAGTPGSVRNAIVSSEEWFQASNAGGSRARLVFTVTCTARL